MSKKIILSIFLLALTTFTALFAVQGAPGDNSIQGIVNLTSVPQTVKWTIETAFLVEINRTQDDVYVIDGLHSDKKDITDYIAREFLLPIPEAGKLSYQIDGSIGAEPEIHIPVQTFNNAGTAQISVFQYSQGSLQAVWLPGFITFTVIFTPEDGRLPVGYILPSAGNGRVSESGMQSFQLPATQMQFDTEYANFVENRNLDRDSDQWINFFNSNLLARQNKRITRYPGIIGKNSAEKTVSWISVKFKGANVQQLSSTIDKLQARIDEPYLASDIDTLLNWGALLIDKSGPFNAVLSETTEAATSLTRMLTYYAYNSQAGDMTDFNFEKNRMLIRELLEL